MQAMFCSQSEHPNDNVAYGIKWTVDQVSAIVHGGLCQGITLWSLAVREFRPSR
jgi:hypothetical protein